MIFGVSGLLPVAAGFLADVLDLSVYDSNMHHFILIYGAVILSFIGGTHWAFAAMQQDRPADTGWLFGISVLPSLAGWALAALPGAYASAGLSLCFLAVLPVDRYLVRAGLAPFWWMNLRLLLSGGMALLFGGFALLSALR